MTGNRAIIKQVIDKETVFTDPGKPFQDVEASNFWFDFVKGVEPLFFANPDWWNNQIHIPIYLEYIAYMGVGRYFFWSELDRRDIVDCSLNKQIHPGRWPLLMAIMRLIFGAIVLGWIIVGIASYAPTYFIYFTNLNFMILSFYFFFSGILGLRYQLSPDKSLYNDKITAVESFLWVIFQLESSNALFLDLVYWVLLYSGIPIPYTFAAHAGNACLILIELFLNRLQFIWLHWIFVASFGISYGIFAIVYFGITDTWVYNFLDWSHSIAPAMWIGVFILNFVFFSLLKGLATIRNKILKFTPEYTDAIELYHLPK